jgi:hypothetical protein
MKMYARTGAAVAKMAVRYLRSPIVRRLSEPLFDTAFRVTGTDIEVEV